MKHSKEDLQKRINEIPQIIDKLTNEYNQLLGYLQCLKDIEDDTVEKKKK